MRAFIALFALTLTVPYVPALAEDPPPADELLIAYFTAVSDLRAGKGRQQIADRLKPVVTKNGASSNFTLVSEFLADLTESAKSAVKAEDEPEKRLADSGIEWFVVTIAENWDVPLKAQLKRDPKDPACQLIAMDRTVIGLLVPLLNNRFPTRVSSGSDHGWPFHQPRVGDVALSIIEYHSLCRFHHDMTFGKVLHQLPADSREEIISRVDQWWKENKNKPVTAGIRAEIPHAESYPAKVWMAKNLIRLDNNSASGDKEFGLNVLRGMVKQNPRNHLGAYAAEALAEFGDTSALDVFYEEWQTWLGRHALILEISIAIYLRDHGNRREWELLHAIATEEIRDGNRPGQNVVWPTIAGGGKAETNPFAIPTLGLALGQTKVINTRQIEKVGAQSFSMADIATEFLQKQLAMDFGYHRSGTDDERSAAIQKAQQWWLREGKSKYSFDYIESHLGPAKTPPSRNKMDE
jgi:hypothetical protein